MDFIIVITVTVLTMLALKGWEHTAKHIEYRRAVSKRLKSLRRDK